MSALIKSGECGTERGLVVLHDIVSGNVVVKKKDADRAPVPFAKTSKFEHLRVVSKNIAEVGYE